MVMSIIKRIYRMLGKIFSGVPLTMIMSSLLAGVIYFFGARVGMRGIYPLQDEPIRFWIAFALFVVAGICALILIFRLIQWLRNLKIERAKREPTEEELEQKAMDQVFKGSLSLIRKRWAGSGQGIYTLPWYLMIGKSGAGKTSLLENSDLRFPIDYEIEQEVATLQPRRAASIFRWRVAGSEAVILDMSGEALETRWDGGMGNVLWDRLLDNINKHRPRRPINGVLLVIDIIDFLAMSYGERENYAIEVRKDINELVERLGTQMTIHTVFTKLDQVAGFSDYFENLNAHDRELLYGFHFRHDSKHAGSWSEQLDQQYDDYVERLQLQLKKRVHQLKNVTSRQEAFGFYRTFVGLQAPLTAFFTTALAPDKFTTAPMVRGVYFLSNRQENVPRNIFLEAVGERYSLPAPLYGTSQSSSFPYFVTPLLKDAVFPEAGLAGNNLMVEKTYRKRIGLAALGGLLICGVGTYYWSTRYDVNLARAQNVLEKTRTIQNIASDADVNPTGVDLLPPLDQIREATFEFGDYRRVGPVPAQLSLYQGRKIGPIADAAYRSTLNGQFAPVLISGLERELREVCPKGGTEELDLLRVYRMLGDLEGRDNRVIEGYFSKYWQASFPQRGEVQERLNEHMDYMLNRVPEAYDTNRFLVRSAQQSLGSLEPYRRVYSSIRAQAERQFTDPLEFRSSVGVAFDIVYESAVPPTRTAQEVENVVIEQSSDADKCGVVTDFDFETETFTIPRFFSRKEYLDFFIPQNERVARVAADDLWVLGQLQSTVYSDEDYRQIEARVRENYVQDFIDTWRGALNSIQLRRFENISDATAILARMSGTDDPIRRLAQLTRDNTVIYEANAQILEGNEAPSSELPLDENLAAGLRINEAFTEIHRMLDEEPGGAAPNIDEIREALVDLHAYMKSIQDAPSPNEKALELAIARAELRGEDPIFVVNRIAERTPAPFDAHLRDAASETWRIIMVAATKELNRRWNEEIFGAYQRLIAGKYPFDRSSPDDIPLEDFEEFFEPGGILDRFYNEELLTFVNESSGEPRIIDGQSLAVDPEYFEQLQAAIDISRSFFDANGDLLVEFKASTVGMSANLARAVLNFEGQLVVSTHGPARPATVVWPNIIGGPTSSRVDLSPLAGTGRTLSRNFDGPWSWLRLYDAAAKSNTTNNSVDISFSNANGQTATFRIRTESAVNVFFNSPLSSFSLPERLRSADS